MAKKPAPPSTPKPLPNIAVKPNVHNNISNESLVRENDSKKQTIPKKN